MQTSQNATTTNPSPSAITQALADRLFNQKVMDNCERGQYVEQMVLSALGDGWKWVGAGWHPWDIESTSGAARVRITRAASSTSGRAKNQIPISSVPAGMAAILRRSGARVKSKAKF